MAASDALRSGAGRDAGTMGVVRPEQGLRWAALLYALVSLGIAAVLVSRAQGDVLDLAIAALVAVQGWALLGFLSLFVDLVDTTRAIHAELVD